MSRDLEDRVRSLERGSYQVSALQETVQRLERKVGELEDKNRQLSNALNEASYRAELFARSLEELREAE